MPFWRYGIHCFYMTNEAPKTGRLYMRYSSTDQSLGDSERRQRTDCGRVIKQHNITIVAEYFDRGISASDGSNRERELARLIRELQQGEYVVVESHHRLSRENPILHGYAVGDIINAGGKVLMANGEIYTSENISELGAMVGASVGSALAHGSNKIRNDMVIKAYAEKYAALERGEKPQMPFYPSWIYWHKYEKRYDKYDNKVAVVKQIFNDYLAGMGTTTIAQKLNDEKIPLFRKGKSFWRHSHIWQILHNPACIGTLVIRGKAYPNYFPAAVDENIYYRVQDLLNKRITKRRGNLAVVRNLFRYFIHCTCGAAIGATPARGGKYHYYHCHAKDYNKCSIKTMVRTDDIELPFLKSMAHSILEEFSKTNTPSKQIQVLEAKLKSISDEQDAMMSLIKDKVGVAKAKNRLVELDNEQLALATELDQLRAQNASQMVQPDNARQLLNLIGRGLVDMEVRRQINNVLPVLVSDMVINLVTKDFTVKLTSGKTLNFYYNEDDGHGEPFYASY